MHPLGDFDHQLGIQSEEAPETPALPLLQTHEPLAQTDPPAVLAIETDSDHWSAGSEDHLEHDERGPVVHVDSERRERTAAALAINLPLLDEETLVVLAVWVADQMQHGFRHLI